MPQALLLYFPPSVEGLLAAAQPAPLAAEGLGQVAVLSPSAASELAVEAPPAVLAAAVVLPEELVEAPLVALPEAWTAAEGQSKAKSKATWPGRQPAL